MLYQPSLHKNTTIINILIYSLNAIGTYTYKNFTPDRSISYICMYYLELFFCGLGLGSKVTLSITHICLLLHSSPPLSAILTSSPPLFTRFFFKGLLLCSSIRVKFIALFRMVEKGVRGEGSMPRLAREKEKWSMCFPPFDVFWFWFWCSVKIAS